MQEFVLITQSVVGILFILMVLIQDKGVGFGTALGGTGGGSAFYATQRGAAQVVHVLSVILAVIFLAMALLYVIIPDSATAPGAPTVSSSTGTPITVNPGQTINVDGGEE
ncbi:MAG: preprotein translocase subunit SecG [bacterium]|nr:preprotein translocase subunit SecG [bacterium]